MTSTIIGDVHGSAYWKEIIKEHPNCRYIFWGDYFDPYEEIDDKALIKNL